MKLCCNLANKTIINNKLIMLEIIERLIFISDFFNLFFYHKK